MATCGCSWCWREWRYAWRSIVKLSIISLNQQDHAPMLGIARERDTDRRAKPQVRKIIAGASDGAIGNNHQKQHRRSFDIPRTHHRDFLGINTVYNLNVYASPYSESAGDPFWRKDMYANHTLLNSIILYHIKNSHNSQYIFQFRFI